MSKIERALELIGLKCNQEFKWQDMRISTDTYLCKVAQDGTVYVWSLKEGKWNTRMFINLRDLLYEPEKIIEVVKGPVIGETYYWYQSATNNPKVWSIIPVEYDGSPLHIAMFKQGFMYSDFMTAEHHLKSALNKYGAVRGDRVAISDGLINVVNAPKKSEMVPGAKINKSDRGDEPVTCEASTYEKLNPENFNANIILPHINGK